MLSYFKKTVDFIHVKRNTVILFIGMVMPFIPCSSKKDEEGYEQTTIRGTENVY